MSLRELSWLICAVSEAGAQPALILIVTTKARREMSETQELPVLAAFCAQGELFFVEPDRTYTPPNRVGSSTTRITSEMPAFDQEMRT